MIWVIILAIGAASLVFWPVYDRIKERKANLRRELGLHGEAAGFDWIKRAVWECPVCGKNHDGKRSDMKQKNCPFEAGDYFVVWKEHLLESTITNLGGHFELPYLVWENDDQIYLTYKPDPYAVRKDQYGQIYVNAYYSALFCCKDKWNPAAMRHEMNLAVSELRNRVLDSLYEAEEHYIVGRNRILDMSVTQSASCAETGYVIWRGKQEIYVTGIRTGASDQIFNYDRISRSDSIHRFHKTYTRRLCGTLEEVQRMPQKEIDSQAYGAYMDGAK